jgi:hypothetical protein
MGCSGRDVRADAWIDLGDGLILTRTNCRRTRHKSIDIASKSIVPKPVGRSLRIIVGSSAFGSSGSVVDCVNWLRVESTHPYRPKTQEFPRSPAFII